MAKYDLTPKQKTLLKIIVEQLNAGTAKEPLIPVCTMSDCSIIGIKGNFDHNLLGDLEILAEAGLLGFRYNRKGDKIYTVKQSGYNAIENNFEIPESEIPTNINIGAIIRDMNGGNVQAIGFSSQSEINQVVNDPKALLEKLDLLAEQLIEAVKSDLPAKELISYVQTVDELKKQLQSEKPSPSILSKLLATVSFLGDVESSISLAIRVWTYVYPFLLIASQKIGGGYR